MTLKKITPLIIGKFIQFKAFITPKKAIEQAFNIFCTPRKGQAKEKHQEFFDTAIEEKFSTNNHQIQTYHWEGKGKTIVLLHGWESNSFRWKSLVELLQKENYNIIAIDAPAQGNSSGKYLNVPLYTACANDVIKAHNPSILIGHSLGGMTAIYHQFKYTNPSIEKIVALGPPSELSFFMKSFQITLGLSDKFMSKMENYLNERFGFYSKQFSISEFAKSIKKEGLLILEKRDKLAPYKYSKRIADNWTNCELYTVENVGHSLQSSDINLKITSYLKQEELQKVFN